MRAVIFYGSAILVALLLSFATHKAMDFMRVPCSTPITMPDNAVQTP